MELNALSISIFFLLFLIALKIVLRSPSPRKRSAPGPLALPIIGHLHLLKKPIHRTFLGLSRRYGPVVSLRLGCRPVVIVSSLPVAEECFTKNDVVLANRARMMVGEYLAYNCTTVPTSSYGHHWRNLRRIGAIEIFSSHRLDRFTEVRKDEVGRLLRVLCRNIPPGGVATVEPRPLLTDLTFNIMMRMLAGKRYYGVDAAEADDEEATQFRGIIRELTMLVSVSYPGDFLPVLRWIDYQGYRKRLVRLAEKANRFLQGLVDERLCRRQGKESASGGSSFMIDHLLSLQESDSESYSDRMIKGLIQVFDSWAIRT
ncbi:hypothetical protein SAY86_013805 [Trapa natans]|uniref:Uncharacterized protein n=1 Tax=Trapa natans TaxID=22666 RepID=A0AAN7KXZ3_TRANT|nr:hypothetical protein SAY86_013805 [Trapa natans]